MSKQIKINNLMELVGEEICEFFILKEILNNSRKNGMRFCRCVISDSTGVGAAVLWGDSMDLVNQSYVGRVVKLQGQVTLHDGVAEITAVSCELAVEGEYDYNDFIVSLEPAIAAKHKNSLLQYISGIKNPTLSGILKEIFTDKLIDTLLMIPASLNVHHIYNGGALEHILEVTELTINALNIDKKYSDGKGASYVPANRELAITGALLHDIGKVYEYDSLPFSKRTKKSFLVGHVNETIKMVNIAWIHVRKKVPEADLSLMEPLEHIIISSHSTIKNSNMPPRTKEALIVYKADDTSAVMNSYDTAFMIYDKNNMANTDEQIYSSYFKYRLLRAETITEGGVDE